MALLAVKNASLAFDQRVIWQHLNLEIQPGEFIAVIGANGSGKSMLLKSILGQQALSSGSIEFLGKPSGHGNTHIGYVPQHRAIDSGLPLKVIDAVRFGLDGHNFGLPLPSAKKKALALEALAQVDAHHLAQTPVGELSGGEMQRVRVAQAVISHPKLILADEPLSALDLHHQQVVSELVHQQSERFGAAVLFVTHDMSEAVYLADRVSLMHAGQIQAPLQIDLPRPRHSAMRYTPAFNALCEQLRHAMDATL